MKTHKILFWITTIIIFLSEGLMPALTFRTPLAISGITSLGYPVYFLSILTAFKILGALALIIPQVPARVKEWAYAGFAIDFICAFASIVIVNGFSVAALLPLVCLVLLVISYVSYHKIKKP